MRERMDTHMTAGGSNQKLNAMRYLTLALRRRANPIVCHYLDGRRVLDAGCGTGEFLKRDPGRFTGIDVNPNLVSHCTSQNLQAFEMSALAIGFPDGSFDAAYASQLIEHFQPSDAATLVSELVRVVVPGGAVVLTTPGTRNVWNTFSHVRPYPPEAFEKLLGSRTEEYIHAKAIPATLEAAYGFSRYFGNSPALQALSNAADLMVTPRDPLGWTVVLRKHPT
jgi:SAM-dependent methyltransferase